MKERRSYEVHLTCLFVYKHQKPTNQLYFYVDNIHLKFCEAVLEQNHNIMAKKTL